LFQDLARIVRVPWIDKNDYVSVSGNIDVDFWGGRELMADSVVTSIDD